MSINLTQNEARVIGCLMEKSVLTPEQYPLTLNALTNACNQKSSRDPILNLDQGTVQRVVRQLADKHLVNINENFRSGVEKYHHRFCNTPLADFQFDEAEFAIICVLLLRGPQTPGELRTRTNRLHQFADNQAVSEVLQRLIDREGRRCVARLPRRPGRQDHEYAHLFGGEIESVEPELSATKESPQRGTQSDRLAALEARVEELERALEELRARH